MLVTTVSHDGPGVFRLLPLVPSLASHGYVAGTIGVVLILPWGHSSYPGVLCSPVWSLSVSNNRATGTIGAHVESRHDNSGYMETSHLDPGQLATVPQ